MHSTEVTKRTTRNQRERILKAFQGQVSRSSFRGVTMSGLAKELGISTKTLYAEFPTKADLVEALVHEWAKRWVNAQREGVSLNAPPMVRAGRLIVLWVEMSKIFGTECWKELRNDFPSAFRLAEDEAVKFSAAAKLNMLDSFRNDVNVDFSMQILFLIIRNITVDGGFDSNQMTLSSALMQAMTIWARGCLKPEVLSNISK